MPDLFSQQLPKKDSCYLVSLDSKNKIRVFYTHYELNEDTDFYEISRYSGQPLFLINNSFATLSKTLLHI